MGYDALWIIPHALRIHSSGFLRKLDPWKYVLSSFRLWLIWQSLLVKFFLIIIKKKNWKDIFKKKRKKYDKFNNKKKTIYDT